MNECLSSFLSLSKIFADNGYKLFLVGGSVRDYLLEKVEFDLDVVTDATPLEMSQFLSKENCDYTFDKFGAVRYFGFNRRFDITTLRKEEDYIDYRRPNKITFVKDIKIDAIRRDFTINAMYMDASLTIFDFYNGQQDLKNHLLKMVGNPFIRLKEDPLRIIRGLRFASDFDLNIDIDLSNAIIENKKLLTLINPLKIKEDILKTYPIKKDKLELLLDKYKLLDYLKCGREDK